MKSILKNLLALSLIVSFSIALSCGDDEPGGDGDNRSDQEIATDSLTSATWTLANGGSVLFDGADVSDEYVGLTMTFNVSTTAANTYSTNNSGGPGGQNPLFSAAGTWNWADGTTNNSLDLNDNDKSLVTVVTLNNTTFRFRFQQLNDSGTAAGMDGLSGNYDITLTR